MLVVMSKALVALWTVYCLFMLLFLKIAPGEILFHKLLNEAFHHLVVIHLYLKILHRIMKFIIVKLFPPAIRTYRLRT